MALATFATLLVLPAVFTLLLGRASNQSPSLDPDDPREHPLRPHPPLARPDDAATAAAGTTAANQVPRRRTRPKPHRRTTRTMPTHAIESRTTRFARHFGRESKPGARQPGPAPGRCRLPALRPGRQVGRAARRGGQERGGQDRRDHGRPSRAARHPDDGRPAGDDRGLRDDPDLFPDLRLRPEVPVQHRRPRQGGRCPDRYVDSRPGRRAHGQKSAAVHRAEVQIGVAAERAAGRRGQARDGQGTDRLGRGRREAGPGQLHPLGVGIQAARDTRHPARPRRAGARRDLSPVRGGRRRPRPGRSHGLGDELRPRPGRSPTATRPASMSRPPAPTSRSPRPTSGRPGSTSSTARSRPPTPA